LEVAFNNKTTEWALSYDGRKNEPVTLPMKFPLLLAQGAEGIAVGLATKILPHNFNELIDASIQILRGKKATIVGVIKKEGKNFIGWDYDNCVMLPYKFCKQIFPVDWTNPVLIAKGKEGVATSALSTELKGIMRQIRRLSPLQEDNFSLNNNHAATELNNTIPMLLTGMLALLCQGLIFKKCTRHQMEK